jgi:prolipoprotein diacylglyceryl transferase
LVLPLSIPSPNDYWQVFNLGQFFRDTFWKSFGLNIDLRASTACIVVGIVVGIIVTSRRLTKRGAEPGIIVEVTIGAIIGSFIFGRILHVLTQPGFYFGAGRNPLTAVYVWEGGLSLFGVLLGGVLGAAVACRIVGLRLESVLDAAVPGLLFAMAAERLGDWFERQYYGTPTSAPWGLQIPSSDASFPVGLPASTVFQPTFAYELIWDLIGIGVLLFAASKLDLQWGKLFGLFLVWYGLGRSWFESLRIDPSLHFLGIRTNVWLAFLAVIIGLVVIARQSRRHTGQEPSVYRQGRGWEAPAAVHSEDTYSDTDDLAASNDGPVTVTDTTNTESVKATRSVTSGAGKK